MRRIVSAIAFVMLTAEAAAQNAPFCVVTSAGRDCFYYDAPTCQQVAADRRGACVVNNSSGAQSQGGGWWDNATRSYDAGRQTRDMTPPEPPAASNIAPILHQFCREMTAQDSAELDRLSSLGLNTDAELQAWTRLLDMYQARSQRCFAMADSLR